MKKIMSVVVVLIALLAGAGERSQRKHISPEELEAARAKRAEKLGGLVTKLPSGKKVVICDAQDAVDKIGWKYYSQTMETMVRVPVDYQKIKIEDKDPITVATNKKNDPSSGIVILMIDNRTFPILLIAPESGWAIVNARALATDGVMGGKLSARCWKEIWRATCLLLGGADTQHAGCLMNYVAKPADLDLLGESPSMEPIYKMMAGAKVRQIDLAKRATYKNACKEGWAPPPTNDIQRVIWNEFHEQPTKPLRIKYNAEAGR